LNNIQAFSILNSMYTTYILKSLKEGTYYYDSTSDFAKRLKYHNSGKSRYTKRKMPWIVYYKEEFETKTEAIQREMFLKSIDGYNYLREHQIIYESWQSDFPLSGI